MKMTLKEINEEIRTYRIPIVRCDAHFNWLLEEKRRLETLINGNEDNIKTKKKKLDDDDGHQCHYG